MPALLVSGATALATGVVMWKFWWWAGYPAGVFTPGLDGHGPDPYAWPRLLALWVPAAHVLFALAYDLLARWDSRGVLRPHRRADQTSLALVLPLLAGLLLVGPEGAWRTLVGAWHTAFIGAKVAILAAGLWRWLSSPAVTPRRAAVGLFLGAFLPYLFLGAHATCAMSATGDEPYYLLVAHSLLHDGDADLANNFAQRDYLPFYWGELTRIGPEIRITPDGRIRAPAYQGFQASLLVPGYALGGRLGAVTTMNVFGALALALAFRLVLLGGASRRAAFLTWLGAAFSVPFVTFSASPFPEATGACLATAAAYLLWRHPVRRAVGLAAAACLVGMVAAKTRLFVVVPPIAVASLRRFSWPRLALAVGVLAAALGAATAYDALILGGHVVRRSGSADARVILRLFVDWTLRAPREYRGQLGLLLDQAFGLLPAAPVFALALSGIVVATVRRQWRLLLVTAGPFLLACYYLGAVGAVGIMSRGVSYWYAGFSPPARFLMASLPLLSVLVAATLDHVRGRLAWSVTAALFAATIAYTAVLSIWPAWRFQEVTGRSTAGLALLRRTGLDPGRFLPSFITPEVGWQWAGLGILIALAAAGYGLARAVGQPAPRGSWPSGIVAAALAAVILCGAAWMGPSAVYPAVLGTGRGGTIFLGTLAVDLGGATEPRQRLVWATQRNGALEILPRVPAGRYRVTVVVGAQATGAGPTLSILAGAGPPEHVTLDSATSPTWRERAYGVDVQWPGGRLPIRLELGQISRQSPERLAYVNAIEIRRLGP